MKYPSCYHLGLGDKPLGVTSRVDFFFEGVKELIRDGGKKMRSIYGTPCGPMPTPGQSKRVMRGGGP